MKIHCATRLEPAEAKKLMELATKRTISRSALMRQIITAYLRRYKPAERSVKWTRN